MKNSNPPYTFSCHTEYDWFKKNIQQKKEPFKLGLLITICLIALAIFLNVKIFFRALDYSQDSQILATYFMIDHQNPYDENLTFHAKILPGVASPYPLTGYLLLFPYALLSWENAKIAWTISNYIFTALLFIGLQKVWKIKNKYLIASFISCVLISNQFRNVIANGQQEMFVFALLVWSIYFARKNKWFAGVLLGLSWFKYSVTLPFTLIFYWRKWRYILIGIVVQFILLEIACLWLNKSPVEVITDWYNATIYFAKAVSYVPYRSYTWTVLIIPLWILIRFLEIWREEK
jgi:Glycosyltransferase family 87